VAQLSAFDQEDEEPIQVYKVFVELNGGGLWGLVKLCETRNEGQSSVRMPFTSAVVQKFVQWLQQSSDEVNVESLDELHGFMHLAHFYAIDRLKSDIESSFGKNETWNGTPRQLGTLLGLTKRFQYANMAAKCSSLFRAFEKKPNGEDIDERFSRGFLSECKCVSCAAMETVDGAAL